MLTLDLGNYEWVGEVYGGELTISLESWQSREQDIQALNLHQQIDSCVNILYREIASLTLNIFPRELCNYSSKDSQKKAFRDIYRNVYMHT